MTLMTKQLLTQQANFYKNDKQRTQTHTHSFTPIPKSSNDMLKCRRFTNPKCSVMGFEMPYKP